MNNYFYSKFWRLLYVVSSAIGRAKYGVARRLITCRLQQCGRNVFIDARNSYFTPELILIGSDVYVGPGADFAALKKRIIIGNKVLIGPNVSIRTDNHNTSSIGSFMYDHHERSEGDEADVIIDDDVWIGTRVTILRGVNIGRGAVIGAGTVVTHSVPPYTVFVGPGAGKVIRKRWTIDQIRQHEATLYPQDRRLH